MFGSRLATRCSGLALAVQALAAASAGAEEPLAFFDPLVTIGPGINREVGVLFDHVRGAEGRRTQGSIRLQYPVLSWLQFSLEMPGVSQDPSAGSSTEGAGDMLLGGQARVWVTRAWPAEIDVGLELTLPTGSSTVLGGSTALRSFAIAGTKLGPLDVVGNVSYQWVTGGPVAGAELFQAVLALGYPVGWIAPFIELVLVNPVRGVDDLRPQVSVLPGVEFFLSAKLSVSVGVQLPIDTPRAFDQRVLGFLKWSF